MYTTTSKVILLTVVTLVAGEFHIFDESSLGPDQDQKNYVIKKNGNNCKSGKVIDNENDCLKAASAHARKLSKIHNNAVAKDSDLSEEEKNKLKVENFVFFPQRIDFKNWPSGCIFRPHDSRNKNSKVIFNAYKRQETEAKPPIASAIAICRSGADIMSG